MRWAAAPFVDHLEHELTFLRCRRAVKPFEGAERDASVTVVVERDANVTLAAMGTALAITTRSDEW
ncbi:hypothetical protein MMAN_01710 [Mycobacterium mantenii]|uniref:Uncharacterized protein n=2 Tax=Mycobacterium mantenii TaxID=560555 RepID=A0ABM7JKQ2_MYCNT|nr:hypothetical protein MMAN_01710 [Mycobacterium mantenii]